MASTHIILPTFGSAGDVNPMIALGKGLRARGHNVTVMTNPYFAQYVAQAGLEFVGIGTTDEHQQVMNNPNLWHPTRSFEVIAQYAILNPMRATYELLSRCDPQQTIIASSGLVFGAHLARETHNLPHVTVQLQPSLLRSVYDPPTLGGFRLPDWLPHRLKRAYFNFLDAAVIDRRLAPPVNAYRAELGLPPAKHFFGAGLHSPQKNIGLFPHWFAPPPPDWPPIEMTGFVLYDAADQQSMLPELAAFLAAGERPLAFTPGSANLYAAQFFAESVQAAQVLQRRALLISPYTEQIPTDLPDTICHVPYAPFSQLLRDTAVLVYHGGIGTLAQAMAAGIPHLVMPLSHDQPDNARHLRRLGVGDMLLPAAYHARNLVPKLRHLLEDETVQANCRRYAAQVDFAAGLAAACAAIEGVAV